ncbi:uncharacterized protein LOC135843768 [Planococcus citri]|uniref:uncharacterized protein LOC135843768 n=1 Tax=Planococcus citri TaxID=170843 RepID=UPI0031FA2E24
MEYIMRPSTMNPTMPSERLDFDTESSGSSSSNECSYISSRNHRKCFWKGGGDYSGAVNKTQLFQHCVKNKKKPRKDKTEAVCTFIRKRVQNVRHSFQNKHTTIKLINVPVKMNNILDLYHNFIRFGTITMIQAQRNSNPYCAILSFLRSEDAKSAMENARKIIPNVRAVWCMDACLSTTNNANYVYTDDTCSSQNISNRYKPNDILSDKLYRTQQLFNADDRNHAIPNYDTKYEQNLEILITELIRKKNRLLSQQMNSMREIIQKINKCEIGGREEKILLELLKKVQIQVQENRKSIDYSVKQRNEYFAKRKMLTSWKGVEKPTTVCPPWISAFRTASAKHAQSMKYKEKMRKRGKTVRVFPISDDDSSTSESEKVSVVSSDESTTPKYYSIFCRKSALKWPKKLHDERYESEMTHLLSDDSNCHEND